MASKYTDTTSIINVIGNIYNKPDLLDRTDKFTITERDFPEQFHKIVMSSIVHLFEQGVREMSLNVIEDFLHQHPKSEACFKSNKGDEWLLQASESAKEESFNYYYQRLKKFTLLREFADAGIDVSGIYDADNILDAKKKQIQEEWLDNHTVAEVSQKVTDKINSVVETCVDNTFAEIMRPGQGLKEYKEQLKLVPAVGLPLYGPIVNTLTRGARLGCFYIRSASSGLGKSRTLSADACYVGCDEIFDYVLGWRSTGSAEPCCYISTEQTLEEVQEMMLAFISGVNQRHIHLANYVGDEEQRVDKAIEVLERSKVYVICLPDFSMTDVENLIKRCIREYGVRYVFFDYLQSSLKILSEITSQTRGMALREDQVLYMLSRHLKDLAVEHDVFIETATQISGDYREIDIPDQRLLRGSKSIADAIDYGSIMLQVMPKDLEKLQEILGSGNFQTPNIKMSIYKNRGNEYTAMYLWMHADPGTCRYDGVFCTDWNYQYLPVDDLKIQARCAF